jgi:hypothetical protein
VFAATAVPFIVALLLFSRRQFVAVLAVWLAPVALGFAGLFVWNHVMGHMGRLFFPALPFLVMAAFAMLDGWLWQADDIGGLGGFGGLRGLVGGGRGQQLLLRGGLALLVLVAGHAALGAAGAQYAKRASTLAMAPLGGYVVSAPPLPEVDSWRAAQAMAEVAAACPIGTRLAMSEHGLPGARAPDAVIIDVLGLHDPAFALRPFSAAELWRRDPDLIWMPHPDHTQMVRDILDSDELWARYSFYPDAFWFGVAIRKKGGYAPVVRRAVEAQWAALYPGTTMAPHEARRARGDNLGQ